MEITEISYFIEFFGVAILPTNFSDISPDNYTDAFTEIKVKGHIYKGMKTLRYRYHYKIFIEDFVWQEDEDKFEKAITDTWFKTYPGNPVKRNMVNQSLYYYFITLWKESLGNNGQQFHQYQQNQQHFSLQIIEHSKDHNAWGSQLESQVLAMDRHKNVTVKPVNGITSLPLLIIGSPMATQI